MTDIDFDELDKAVNSALAPRLAPKEEVPAAPEPAAATPVSEPVVTAPAPERSSEAPKIILNPRPRPGGESPAAKRSGRFMDMVHPSSDMADKKLTPAPKVKIVPTENAPKPDEIAEPAKKPDIVEGPAPKVELKTEEPANIDTGMSADKTAPSLEESEVDMKSEYPDPIDVAGPLSVAEEPTTPAKDEAEVSEPVPANPETAVPAEAPFLPDAKVEKRPLGGFAPDESSPASEEGTGEDESQLPPDTALPAALQSDVVAVESDVLPEIIPGLNPDNEAEDEDAPKPPKPEEKPFEKPVQHESTPVRDNGPAQSIPQQYHAEPTVADEEPRPVFDTDQYHQPLIPAHAGKKSHAWVFILLVAALLAVGGTLGYFAFMSGL